MKKQNSAIKRFFSNKYGWMSFFIAGAAGVLAVTAFLEGEMFFSAVNFLLFIVNFVVGYNLLNGVG